MKKNVNFFLLGVMVMLLVSMVGLSFYFTITYQQLRGRYDDASRQLEDLSLELGEKIKEVNQTSTELEERERTLVDIVNQLNLSQKKISSLGDFYTTEKGIKEDLVGELSTTQQERDFWKLNYTQAQQDLQLWKKNYQVKEQELTTTKVQINRLNNVVTNVEREIKQDDGAEKNLNDAQNKINSLKSVLNDLESDVNDVNDDNVQERLEEEVEDLWSLLSTLENRLDDLQENLNAMKSSLDNA